MIKTQNILLSPSDINTSWGFEHYLNLPKGVLRGSDYMTRSPLTVDYEPSFQIYKPKSNPDGPYRWRCFSSGTNGSLVGLVARMKGISYQEAFRLIKADFESGNEYIANTPLPNTKGRVTDYELRKWTKTDYEWWKAFGISPATLDKYNVSCMDRFVMKKIKDGQEQIMEFRNPLCFSYFTKTGDLARIYQPTQTKGKFIKVLENNWIQAYDQLPFKASRLFIVSSLKDIMALDELELPGIEFVAPDSENIPLRKQDMEFFRTKYSQIGVLFDNDIPGRNAAAKYVERYQTEDILLDLSKDASDSIRDFGTNVVRLKLMQLL